MTRKKVTLAFIANDSERKASFKKRKKGLIKKISELSTLCDVEACAIIYSPYDEHPEVWPSRQGAEAVLSRYTNLPTMDQTRKTVNQESFTRQRIKKAKEQFQRIQKENKRKELEMFMYQCVGNLANMDNFDIRDAVEMRSIANQALRAVNAKLDDLQGKGGVQVQDDDHHEVAVGPENGGEDENNLESFPWNLVSSPSGAGGANGLGWGINDVLPYPYPNASTSVTPPEIPPLFRD